MKKILWIGIATILLLIVIFVLYSIRDRNPGYSLNLTLPQTEDSALSQFQVGMAKRHITPPIVDSWVDVDSNAVYEPQKGDYYVDENNNSRFDAFWLAGFHNSRPAMGIHDSLWARTILWDDGRSKIALVVVDAIGMFHDDVIRIRKKISRSLPEIDHVIVSATHCHEVPDLMGQWGPSLFKRGVNKDYLKFVQNQVAESVRSAWDNRRPAHIAIGKIDSVEKDLVHDSRPPVVYDDAIRMMKIEDAESGVLLGILLNYGCHPETLGDKNLYITADFVHYWLSGIENGIFLDDQKIRPGLGGTAIFANGAVGGLMTGLNCPTFDPWLNKRYDASEESFDKAATQGYRLADKVIDYITSGKWISIEKPQITLRAKTFYLPIKNTHFLLAGLFGLFDRGFHQLNKVRSEVNVFQIGSAWFITMPGEVNPEIINGGVETPEERDFPASAVEVPPLRELSPGTVTFALGLANDEVGYIMPKSHWDRKSPFTYGRKKAMYGETNSAGPDTGPLFHDQVKQLINSLTIVEDSE